VRVTASDRTDTAVLVDRSTRRAGKSSYDFHIDRADGSVTATTASGGAIRIGRMTHGLAKLMNGSGNIEVGIGEGTAAYVDVSSERGSARDAVSSVRRHHHSARG
jgi:hypothetical protein